MPATIDDTFPVTLESPEDCPRYLARVIRNIDPDAKTPLWMVEKLRRCGIRAISPTVDVTNYVMLELGQPMHAFDLNRLERGIRVRKAKSGEQLELLDGRVIDIEPDVLVIADEERAVALAGVMGGEQSGVAADTKDLLLECAFFAQLGLAGVARRYGLHTDASHRYERGVDPELQWRATGAQHNYCWTSSAVSRDPSMRLSCRRTYLRAVRSTCVLSASACLVWMTRAPLKTCSRAWAWMPAGMASAGRSRCRAIGSTSPSKRI